MTQLLQFYLNGHLIELEDPPPDLLLLDFLRTPEVALIGAKKGCGQGGCGACTVILSEAEPETGEIRHRSINSCLRPICSLQGLSITTVEGTGAVVPPPGDCLVGTPSVFRAGVSFDRRSARDARARGDLLRALNESLKAHRVENPERPRATRQAPAQLRPAKLRQPLPMFPTAGFPTAGLRATAAPAPSQETEPLLPYTNPVAYRLALNNGSQCGYCSVGFVMTMSAFLLENPSPTKKEIEEAFDGNICRCTGYRPILTAMKTFARDWNDEDEADRMDCLVDPAFDTARVSEKVIVEVPGSIREPRPPLELSGGHVRWRAVSSIDELCTVVQESTDETIRLVHGNTSFGVYPDEFRASTLLLDIRGIEELDRLIAEPDRLIVGAGVRYATLLTRLRALIEERGASDTSRLGAMELMTHRTAGAIVRNAASIGGNCALVIEHILAGEPFPSDLMTALTACEVQIEAVQLLSGERARWSMEELVRLVRAEQVDPRRLLLVSFTIPLTPPAGGESVLAQKVALREVNAHSIVNVTSRLGFDEEGSTQATSAALIFGGIAPYPFRAEATERLLLSAPLRLSRMPELTACLDAELLGALEYWRARLAGLPDEGFTDEYRLSLARSFLYKAVVNALNERAPSEVPAEERSAGLITWGRRPVSTGKQSYQVEGDRAPTQEPYIGYMTLFQTSGQVHYTHEQPVPPTALNGALVQSKEAPRTFFFQVPEAPGVEVSADALRAHLRERFDDFAELITAQEIPPGGINLQGMGADQPLFSTSEVLYPGQCLAMVLARDAHRAVAMADYVRDTCVGYGPLDWWTPPGQPILSLTDAIERKSIFPDTPASAPFVVHVWRITRPGSVLDWVDGSRPDTAEDICVREVAVDGHACSAVSTSQMVGGQLHFYMETQACVAIPQDGNIMLVHPSSQSPMEMHQTSAAALGAPQNRVRVQLRQVGGGYGGKTEQARFITGPTVVAAHYTNRPVRLVMERAADSALVGRRHPYFGQCQIALDKGEARAEDKGLIRGFDVKMWGDGGAFYDCSFIVSNNIITRADNAYMVPNSRMQIDVCRTNKAPNTAMRSFGDVQSKLITENAIDDAAFALGMSAEAVRRKNLYRRGDSTPFGQALSYCYIREVWDHLAEVCKYEEKKAQIDRFNRENKWRKRGIAMIPAKYGSGYNFVMLEQASASVSVYSADGTVVIHQGGADMGQGSLTQVLQVAAYILNIPMSMVRIELPDTAVIPNPTSTGASTGTAYNAEAAKGACEILRQRLTDFGYSLLKEMGETWCQQEGIDFWSYGKEGWAAKASAHGGEPKTIWHNLVSLAYQRRISLVAQYFAPIRTDTTPAPAIEFKPAGEQPDLAGVPRSTTAPISTEIDNFSGFTYSAAACVAEVDILTGESTLLECDLMYDMGWSINPALDIGQVEGAFIQGLGLVLTESLVWEPEGENAGRLNTDNTWRYKPPAAVTIPLRFDTHLFPRDLASSVPENPNELLSAKEVGEPPLVLAVSAFFAIKQAIRASRLERGLDGLFCLPSPATVQAVQQACELTLKDLGESEES